MEDFYYTVLPPQKKSTQQATRSRLMKYRGVLLYAAPYDAEHYQIQQLCSTNPADYLCVDLQPGSLIPLLRTKTERR